MSGRPWFVAIDLQRVFGDPSSAWCAPRYAAAAANVARLAARFGDRSVFTRFVAPAEPTGAWGPYYEEFPWALQPADSRLYELTDDVAAYARTTVVATTFGKWTADLRAVVGEQPTLVVAGVATDCCVVSTVLAAADAGASITVGHRRLRRVDRRQPPEGLGRDGPLRAARHARDDRRRCFAIRRRGHAAVPPPPDTPPHPPPAGDRRPGRPSPGGPPATGRQRPADDLAGEPDPGHRGSPRTRSRTRTDGGTTTRRPGRDSLRRTVRAHPSVPAEGGVG